MSKLEGTKKMIRAVLLSCKEGIPAHKMNGDYKALTGGGIPFVKLGFNSVEEFIRSIPDVVRVSQNRGEIMYHAVADASTAHIQKMVSKQKSKKKKVKAFKGYRPYQRSYGGMSSGTQRRMGYSPQIRGPRPRAGLLPTPKPAFRPSPQPLKRIVPKRPLLPIPTTKSVYTNPLGNCRTDAPHHHHTAATRPSAAQRPMPSAAVRRNTVANQNPTSLQNRTVTAKSAGGMSVTLKNASVHNRQVTGAYRVCDTIPKVTGACHIKPPVQRTVTVKKVPPVAKPIKRTISLNADDVYTSGKSVQPQRMNLTKGSKVTHSGAENYHPNLPPRLQKVRQEEKDWKEEFVECNRSPVTKQSVSNNVKSRIKEILARNPGGVHSVSLSTMFYERFKTELPQSVVHGLECGNIRDVATVKKQTRGVREKIMLYPKKDPIPESNAASVDGAAAKQAGQIPAGNWQKQIVEIQDKAKAPANIEKGTLEKVRKLLAKNISGVHSINLESMYFDLYGQRLPSRVVLGLECGLLKDVAVVEKLTLGNKEKIIFYPIRESQKRAVSGTKETLKPKTSRPLSGSVNDAKTVKDPSPLSSRRSSSSTENDANVLVGDFTKERIRKILSTSPQGVAATSFGALFHETYKYKLSDVVLQRLADGELDDVAKVQNVRVGNVEKIIIFPLKKAVECKAPKYSAISMKVAKIPERRELSPGSEHEVNISHIDGCRQFYVQLFSCHNEFKTVLEFAKCIKFGTMETVAMGMDVMTSFEPGRRARIVSIADDKAEVFHIDFGDTRRVRKTELAVVPAEIAAIPAMAIQCRLHKPASSGAVWSDYASLKFQQMCLDESAKIKVNSVERLTSSDGRESCIHTVTCYINNFNVNGRLQHEELAHEAAKAHTPDQTASIGKKLESSQRSSIVLPSAETDTQPHQDVSELDEESDNESSYETIESASSCGDISGDEEWVTDVTESRHSTSDHRTHGGYIVSASDVRTGKSQMSMGDSYKSIQKAERPTLAKIEAEKSSNSDVLHTTNTTKETNYPKDVHPSTQAGVAYVKHELHTKLDAPTSAQLGSQKVKTEPRTQLPPNESAFRNVQGNASLPAAPPGLKPCVGGFGLPFPPPGFESPFVQPGTLNIKTEPCTPPVLTSGSGDQSFQTQPCKPTRRLAPPPGFEPMPPAHPANLNIKTDPCMKPVLPAEFGDGNTSRFKNPLLPSPVPESKPNQPNRVVETPSEEWMPLGTSSAVPSPVAFTEGGGRRTSWACDAGVDADFATLKHGVRSESVDYDTTSKNLGPRRPPVGAAGGGGSYISSRNTSLSSGIGSPVVLPSPQKGMTERTPRPNSVPALFNVSDTPYACERGSPLGSTGAPMSTQRSFGSMKIEAYLDKNDNLTPVHDPKWGKAGLPGSIRSYPRDTVYLTAPLQLPCKVRTFGKLIDVIVTHVVSPGMFFMVPTEKMAILGAFTRSLTEYYTNNFTPVSDVKKDTTYVAICEVNGATACHRVKVCQPIGGFASVFLIDQGRFDCVPIKNICDISPRFTTFTPFAINGRLAGIKPKIVTDESIAAITRRYEERVLRKELVAHVLRMSKVKDQFVYDVALCDVSGEVEDEWINDTMVEDWGVADYVSKLDSSHAMPE